MMVRFKIAYRLSLSDCIIITSMKIEVMMMFITIFAGD